MKVNGYQLWLTWIWDKCMSLYQVQEQVHLSLSKSEFIMIAVQVRVYAPQLY